MTGPSTRRRVLEFITSYQTEHGYGPTHREIGDAVGLGSTSSVAHQIEALVAAGRLQRRPGKFRVLTVPAGRDLELAWRCDRGESL